MKKIMIALALVASCMLANAQKSADVLLKGINAAKEATLNPKKAEKPATWIALGKKNLDAYKEAFGAAIPGISREMVQETNGNFKPTGSATEEVGGVVYTVDIYPTCKYYYTENRLAFIRLTQEIVPGALDEAVTAYAQAAKVDPKGSKADEIKKALSEISDLYNNDAINCYNAGEQAKASKLFIKSYEAKLTAPLSKVDTSTIFNAGLSAQNAGDIETAKVQYEKALSYGYSQDGFVPAKLAECQKALGDVDGAKQTLENAFLTYPSNQNILINLINIYLDTNDDPQKIIALLKKAQENEPTNASLYYVEGNMYAQFGDTEKAIEAYNACSAKDPKYPYGEIGKALMYYGNADKIRIEADAEMNMKKYEALVVKYDEALLESAKCFENAFEIAEDNGLKKNLADYLKSIYFRFRENPEHQGKYEKYKAIFDSLQ